MRKQIAQQTLFTILAWLILQSFNATALKAGTTYPPCGVCSSPACAGRAIDGGKSTESFRFTKGMPTPHRFAPEAGYRIKKVVLDAGHGGKDPGCIGASSREKHNALAIVLKLGVLLKDEFPDVEVIYTRETDVFVELNERAAIANRNNADLFISVHCNSISVSRIKGTETYVMGLHTADHNLEVAKRENASILLEDNYQKNYGGYDPNSAEAHILGSMWQSAYLEQSILFASFVQQYAKELANREDRGVKQAGFLVLRETAMPSVLVEAGYLTNRSEENFIASEEGQMQMATSIFEAFRAYKAQMEGAPLAAREQPANWQTTKSGNPLAVQTNNQLPANTVEKPPHKTPEKKPAVQPSPKPASAGPAIGAAEPDQYADEIAMPVVAKNKVSGNYRIHLLSWTSRLDKNAGQLSLIGSITEEQSGGQYHYFTGKFNTRAEAEKMLAEVVNLGFRTATILQHPNPNN